jgi:Sugar phosphate isomerases/epimerases
LSVPFHRHGLARGTLVDKLTAISAAGFDGVEIFENDLFYFDGTAADVKRIADDRGLRIMLFQPFRDFEAGRAKNCSAISTAPSASST